MKCWVSARQVLKFSDRGIIAKMLNAPADSQTPVSA
jgi:hypothetical protein